MAVAAYPLTHLEEAREMTPPVKTTDVSRVSLTVPMAIGMAVFVAAMVGGFWATIYTYSQRTTEIASDVRDIKTRLEFQSKIDEANKRADSMVQDTMKVSIDELRRQMQLLQMQYAELAKQITRK